jgi:hypothetical protein
VVLAAGTVIAGLQPNKSTLTNCAPAGDQDSGASAVAALTGLTFEYDVTLWAPDGKSFVVEVYDGTLTVTGTGLTPGAVYIVECQYLVVLGWYQLVPWVQVTADSSGRISASFDILVDKSPSQRAWIPVWVSRVVGTPQEYGWMDTLICVLQGSVSPKGG